MSDFKFELQEETHQGPRIKVIGVGGGGSNSVGRLYADGLEGVEFYVMNTDAQALNASRVPNRVQIGEKITHGLGAGSDPTVGREAALEDTDKICAMLEGADL
ncbi:MAG: cell division protein FtsZ, partial [Acidobacteriia bacterium]|nr:cell division protein FtsZ [Terriglobia bacterium]